MKRSSILLFPLLLLFVAIMACTLETNVASDNTSSESHATIHPDSLNTRLRIRIGSSPFTATLLTNPTVTAFKVMLPMTLSMSELNGNEKFYRFSTNLPIHASNPGTIQTGDLMIYSTNTLVLFYESFRTSYSYTRLGRIDNTAGLAAALGSGSVTITFELE